ncbi:IniB N-terminal domain-containing protein [Microbacterium sp. ET2]|uniref:IniB N-terminal domain-containing protein n=1 Tax=Microbacterium albipurpureum TaxID=3050384 RepID=UPI00259C842C|nr:IniB N-terminal domain-containing protein [Microbacterium sp. ET2 (Ac-2212)]WJL94832.1 IniB N-terminal domain-containing protein [Microbacterium sp. ET2 (Ac-2212)]
MTTPLATIADALIEFILSLLNDPDAAAEYDANPEAALASAGLAECTAEDVRAVAPIIVDRPDVHPTPHPNPPGPGPKPPVEKEIWNIANNFHIDNRATVVDQSVNQNIWANGDVNQIFDQEAVIASGDQATAAGEDASVDNSETDVEVGDVAIGNEETNVDITDSFDDESTNTENDVTVVADESFNDESTNVDADVSADNSFNDTTEVVVEESYDYDNSGNIASDDAVVYTEETDQP